MNSLILDKKIGFEYGLGSASPKHHVGITPNVCLMGLTMLCTLLQHMYADLTPKCLKTHKVVANIFQFSISQGGLAFSFSFISFSLS